MARQASSSPAKKKAAPKATVTQMLTTPGSGGRRAFVSRATKETRIAAAINLDGTGKYDIKTGIGFLDHMLEQLSRHSLIDITLRAEGDLHIDYHHTTEDSGIVLGECLTKALGDRAGIRRYGAAHIPMDETLTEVALDASNRPLPDLEGELLQAQARHHGHRAVQGVVPGASPSSAG